MKSGTHDFEYDLESEFFANMESSDIRRGDVKVNLSVTCKNDLFVLDFKFAGSIFVPCDRCLDDLELPVDTTYHLSVKFGETYSDESDDLLIIPQSDNYLNIAYMLYDSIALTIPLKHVHPAGKCNKGMAEQLKKHSAHSGDESDFDIDNEFSDDNDADFDDKNDNNESDPRWDALKKLTDNN